MIGCWYNLPFLAHPLASLLCLSFKTLTPWHQSEHLGAHDVTWTSTTYIYWLPHLPFISQLPLSPLPTTFCIVLVLLCHPYVVVSVLPQSPKLLFLVFYQPCLSYTIMTPWWTFHHIWFLEYNPPKRAVDYESQASFMLPRWSGLGTGELFSLYAHILTTNIFRYLHPLTWQKGQLHSKCSLTVSHHSFDFLVPYHTTRRYA